MLVLLANFVHFVRLLLNVIFSYLTSILFIYCYFQGKIKTKDRTWLKSQKGEV